MTEAEPLVERQPGDPPTPFIIADDGLYVRVSCLPNPDVAVQVLAACGRLETVGGEIVLPVAFVIRLFKRLQELNPDREDYPFARHMCERYQAAFAAAGRGG